MSSLLHAFEAAAQHHTLLPLLFPSSHPFRRVMQNVLVAWKERKQRNAAGPGLVHCPTRLLRIRFRFWLGAFSFLSGEDTLAVSFFRMADEWENIPRATCHDGSCHAAVVTTKGLDFFPVNMEDTASTAVIFVYWCGKKESVCFLLQLIFIWDIETRQAMEIKIRHEQIAVLCTESSVTLGTSLSGSFFQFRPLSSVLSCSYGTIDWATTNPCWWQILSRSVRYTQREWPSHLKFYFLIKNTCIPRAKLLKMWERCR